MDYCQSIGDNDSQLVRQVSHPSSPIPACHPILLSYTAVPPGNPVIAILRPSLHSTSPHQPDQNSPPLQFDFRLLKMSLIHRTMPFVIIINLLLKNQLPHSLLLPVLLLFHLLTPSPTADFTVGPPIQQSYLCIITSSPIAAR